MIDNPLTTDGFSEFDCIYSPFIINYSMQLSKKHRIILLFSLHVNNTQNRAKRRTRSQSNKP